MTRITSDNIASLSPSDLLLSALSDLAKCEADPNYRVDMRFWHKSNSIDGICEVCLAGAVMVNSLHVPAANSYLPEDFDHNTKNALRALNCFREGNIWDALARLGYCTSIDYTPRDVVAYNPDNSNLFFHSMMLIHTELLELGY